MLCLTRKEQQSILIGDDIIITLIKTKGSQARIGILAPSGVRVLREEIAGQGQLDNARFLIQRGRTTEAEEAELLAEERMREAERVAYAAECQEIAEARRAAEVREQLEWQRWAEGTVVHA